MDDMRFIHILESYDRMIQRYYDEYEKYPEALISDLWASIKFVLNEERRAKAC